MKRLLIAFVLLVTAVGFGGGYGYPPVGTNPLEFEVNNEDTGSEYYFFVPITEANVELAEPGKVFVHTKQTLRNGTVLEREVEMFGDGTSFAWSYSPGIVIEVETTAPIKTARFRQ